MPVESGRKKLTTAQKLVRDPGFQYAFKMHALIQMFYGNNKAERLRQYEAAGIRKALRSAERRVRGDKEA